MDDFAPQTIAVPEKDRLDEAALTQWVSEYVKNAGGRVDAGSARLLTNYVGSNQLQLKNELDKLVAYDPTITSETIELLVERRPQDTVFQLLDSALSGNQKKALEILDNLEAAHEDAFQVANLLIWQTHILAVVQSAGTVTEAEIAKAAKLNPYVVRKTKGLVARLSKTQVNKIVDRVAELDVLLKTSAVNPWRALEQILVALQV